MTKKGLRIVAGVASIVAALLATSACWFFIYQPEEPKSLQS